MIAGIRFAALSAALFCATACAAHPEPGTAPPADAAAVEDRAADFAAYRENVFGRDRSFPAAARIEAERRLPALEARADTLSDAGFALALASIQNLADNGHTMLFSTPWRRQFNRLPLRFLIADDGLFVAQSDVAEIPAGSRVVAVEGRDLAALREVLDLYLPGRQGYRDVHSYAFLESPAILHAAQLAADPDRITLTIERDGERQSRTVAALPATGAPMQGLWDVLPPPRLLEIAVEASSVPLYLQEPEQGYRSADLPESDAVYIQFRQNFDDDDGPPVAEFPANLIERLRADPPRFVILDERFNIGGDLNATRDLMQALPDSVGPDGHVYALISGRTFSAGISSVGYLEQAGGERVTLIGAPVGDRLEFWAEGDLEMLPHSGAALLYATERHDYGAPCDTPDCHGSIVRHPIRVDDLDPDIAAGLTYADFAAGRDPLLEAALSAIAARR